MAVPKRRYFRYVETGERSAHRSNETQKVPVEIPTLAGPFERNRHTDIRAEGSTKVLRERNYGHREGEESQTSGHPHLRGPPTHVFFLVNESVIPTPRASPFQRLVHRLLGSRTPIVDRPRRGVWLIVSSRGPETHRGGEVVDFSKQLAERIVDAFEVDPCLDGERLVRILVNGRDLPLDCFCAGIHTTSFHLSYP